MSSTCIRSRLAALALVVVVWCNTQEVVATVDRYIQLTPECVPATDGKSVKLKRCLGGQEGAQRPIDPFLVFDFYNSTNKKEFKGGFPAHPHRGFLEIRYLLRGELSHKDSCSGAATIRDGGAQLLHTGRGIAHEEKTDGDALVGFQVWVNLPHYRKLEFPDYFKVDSFTIHFKSDARWSVLCGIFDDHEGPFTRYHKSLLFMDIERVGYREFFTVTTPPDNTVIVFCYKGAVNVGKDDATIYTLLEGEFAILSSGDEINMVQLEEKGDSSILLLSAPKLREPVFLSSGFAAASKEALDQAMEDLKNGNSTHCPPNVRSPDVGLNHRAAFGEDAPSSTTAPATSESDSEISDEL